MHHFQALQTRKTLDNAEIYSKKPNFFQKNFDQKLVEKSENFRLKTKCNLRIIFHHLSSSGMSYMGYRPEECHKVVLALWKNLGFQLLWPKTRVRRSFVHPKIRLRSIPNFSIQLTNKQTNPTNAFVENQSQNYET